MGLINGKTPEIPVAERVKVLIIDRGNMHTTAISCCPQDSTAGSGGDIKISHDLTEKCYFLQTSIGQIFSWDSEIILVLPYT